FINVKGEVTGDIHVEITDASRQTLCNAPACVKTQAQPVKVAPCLY
ncbi:hypothetical protein ACOYSL_005109, partial [Escherichia coli]